MQTANRPPIMPVVAADRALRSCLQARLTGHRLARTRAARGVSQAELAAYVGVSRGTISNVERGQRTLTPMERAACARALGCSIATLAASAPNGNGRVAA